MGVEVFGKEIFSIQPFHHHLLRRNSIEMMSIILCQKLWGKSFKGKRIKIFCENMAVCQVINSCNAKCEILQNGSRGNSILTAFYECEIRTVCLESKANRISDHLSRRNLNKRAMMALKRSPELRLAMKVIASEEKEMPIKGFSCFSSGGHFVQWSKTILANLVESHSRNISMKLF